MKIKVLTVGLIITVIISVGLSTLMIIRNVFYHHDPKVPYMIDIGPGTYYINAPVDIENDGTVIRGEIECKNNMCTFPDLQEEP